MGNHTRREFLKRTARVLAGAVALTKVDAVTRRRYDGARDERADSLGTLYSALNGGKPSDVSFHPQDGTELIVTHVDKPSEIRESYRTKLPQHFKLYGNGSMDFRGSDDEGREYSFEGLKLQETSFEPPEHYPHDLGTLVVDLDDGKLTITQHERGGAKLDS